MRNVCPEPIPIAKRMHRLMKPKVTNYVCALSRLCELLPRAEPGDYGNLLHWVIPAGNGTRSFIPLPEGGLIIPYSVLQFSIKTFHYARYAAWEHLAIYSRTSCSI